MAFVSIETATADSIEAALDDAVKAVATRNGMDYWPETEHTYENQQITTPASRKYIACAKAGMTRTETAEHLGVTYLNVVRMGLRYNIDFVDGRKK